MQFIEPNEQQDTGVAEEKQLLVESSSAEKSNDTSEDNESNNNWEEFQEIASGSFNKLLGCGG